MKNVIRLTILGLTLASSTAFSQCADISAAGVWDSVKTGDNPVVSTTDNPIDGTCVMAVPVEQGKRYVQDDMDQETSFRASWKFDPNTINIPTEGDGRKIKNFNVQCDGGCATSAHTDWFQSKLRRNPDGFKLGTFVRESDGTKVSATYDLNDGCNTVEIQLIAGNPGTYKIWVNNNVEASPDFELSTLNFDGKYTDRVRVGRMGQGININANTNGEVFYVDSYESRRQTFIGASCN